MCPSGLDQPAFDLHPRRLRKHFSRESKLWVTHSLQPTHLNPASFRVEVGAHQCQKPYALSLLNISGMSFGTLSPNAVKALNKGAAMGQFAHDTGEGSISRHHREPGGDLIWKIASGYLGCRTPEGRFDPVRFAKQTRSPQVKMIELKLSQGGCTWCTTVGWARVCAIGTGLVHRAK